MKRYKSVFKENVKFLYHVTFTKQVPKIKKNGILPFQTTNWKTGTGERYGEGEIYAFSNFTDAVKWGAKMEWDFKAKKPEDISIIKIKNTGKWEVDSNDPLGQVGKKGKWMKKMGKVIPEEIVAIKQLTRDFIRKIVADEDLTNEF